MEKKTKNIIAIIIIVVLLICLAFTIRGNGHNLERNKVDRLNTLNEIQKKEFDDRLMLQEKETENTTDEKEKDAVDSYKNAKRPPLRENSRKELDRNANFNMPQRESHNTSIGVILIAIETFLLGGAVMFLIYNNIGNTETKNNKNK